MVMRKNSEKIKQSTIEIDLRFRAREKTDNLQSEPRKIPNVYTGYIVFITGQTVVSESSHLSSNNTQKLNEKRKKNLYYRL